MLFFCSKINNMDSQTIIFTGIRPNEKLTADVQNKFDNCKIETKFVKDATLMVVKGDKSVKKIEQADEQGIPWVKFEDFLAEHDISYEPEKKIRNKKKENTDSDDEDAKVFVFAGIKPDDSLLAALKEKYEQSVRVDSKVTTNTYRLVTHGKKAFKNVEIARELGVKIISFDEFLKETGIIYEKPKSSKPQEVIVDSTTDEELELDREDPLSKAKHNEMLDNCIAYLMSMKT